MITEQGRDRTGSPPISVAKSIEPIDIEHFCSFWLNPSDRERWDFTYRRKCIRFVAGLIHKSERTVERWTDNTEFQRMPDWAKDAIARLHWTALEKSQNAA